MIATKATNQKTSSILRTAAYRSGGVLAEKDTGEVHDFSRKRGIEWTGIEAPSNAPSWVYDRARLWNAVEDSETRINSRLAREAEITIPRELTQEQGLALVRRFVREQFVARGMVADIAIHRVKSKHDGEDQPHAHVLCTTRAIGPNGFGEKRREWNDKALLRGWREAWQHDCNAALADAGSDARVDHRTLEAQAIDRKALNYLGVADHTKHEYDYTRNRRQRQEDIRDHNAGLSMFGGIARVVMAAMQGGPGAAALAFGTELGLLPAGVTARGSIFADVVRNVERGLGHA